MLIGFWWEKEKERHYYENQNVGRNIILKWILEKYDGVAWTGLIWHRIRTIGGLWRTR
jgi:hypothetical protein